MFRRQFIDAGLCMGCQVTCISPLYPGLQLLVGWTMEIADGCIVVALARRPDCASGVRRIRVQQADAKLPGLTLSLLLA